MPRGTKTAKNCTNEGPYKSRREKPHFASRDLIEEDSAPTFFWVAVGMFALGVLMVAGAMIWYWITGG